MGGFMQLLPIILMFVVLYFLMIRPQMKRAKEHKALIEALAKGDEVVTGGGIAGRVTRVSDNFLTLEIAPTVEIQVQKQAVTVLLPKGTLKAL
ncbi:MAG TPA: preprotein translocase subunit YajC [Candidatus Accumulibacter phosphatis]|nr:preprotein translocase subunit YajC [Candidatus Accumulibacter phosphatis]